MKEHFSRSRQDGYTLPVFLMISFALLVICLSMFQAASSIRRSINNQYYNRLASEAALSGVTYGNYCLTNNNYNQSWGPAIGKPDLTQSTDCFGSPATNPVTELFSTSTLKSTFDVGDTTGRPDGATLIVSTGTVQRLQVGTGNVIETYTKTYKRVARSNNLNQSQIVYGYANWSPYGVGAFFATLGPDGQYRAAGANSLGQLGNGTINNTAIPTIYNLPAGKTAAKAFTNSLSIGLQLFVLTTDGELYGSGKNNWGQLGTGSASGDVSTPVKVNIPSGEKVVYVGVGGKATFALTDQNNIYAMGSCLSGMLGIGTGSGKCPGTSSSDYKATPTRVPLPTPNTSNLNTIPAQNIVFDRQSAYVRMQGGAVYGWGSNSDGELGNNSTTDSTSPVHIKNNYGAGTYFGDAGRPKAKQIVFDGVTIYIVADDGKAYAAGYNAYGEVGYNPTTSSYPIIKAIPIPLASGEKVIKASTDQWFASFLTDKGNVYSIGDNSRGQLGNGSTAAKVYNPTLFRLPTGVTATDIYTASLDPGDYSNTFVIGSNGKVYGAGSNAYGQLGNCATYGSGTVSTPVAMDVFNGSTVKATPTNGIVSGFGSTIVLTTTGSVYSVGNNDYGQLGTGNTTSTCTPAKAGYLQPLSPKFVF